MHGRSSATRGGSWALVVGGFILTFSLAACDSTSDNETPPETTAATTVPEPATETTTPRAESEPGTFVADATPLPTGFASLEVGTYWVDTLGTPFSFTIDPAVFYLQANSSGGIVLTAPNSRGPDDRDMVFVRLSALPDPSAPNASGEGWPAEDFGGWLDNLSDDVLVSNREDTTLGGLEATRADLELGDIECCVRFGGNKVLNPGAKYRIWVVDQEAEPPIAVILGIQRESDSDWFDAFEKVLSTLAFGS